MSKVALIDTDIGLVASVKSFDINVSVSETRLRKECAEDVIA